MRFKRQRQEELEMLIKHLEKHPELDTYTGYNSLADCKCKLSEEYYVELMLLKQHKINKEK